METERTNDHKYKRAYLLDKEDIKVIIDALEHRISYYEKRKQGVANDLRNNGNCRWGSKHDYWVGKKITAEDMVKQLKEHIQF